MSMFKLGLIGCGGIGAYHLDHFMQMDDVEMVAFCDIIPERAQAFAKQTGTGQAFANVKDMYAAVQPDAVFICIPPYCHGEVELETIKHGIPFFVEKPMAMDMALAEEIAAAADAKGLITAVGLQCRYDNINEAAFRFIRENEVVVVDGSRVGGIPSAPWWNKRDLSGGQLVEQTIHQLDIMRYLLGDVKSVYAVAARGFVKAEESPGYDTDDLSLSVLQFKSGVTGYLMTGCYSQDGASWDSKITFGTRASRMDYRLCADVTVYGLAEQDKAATVDGVIEGDGTQRRNEAEVGQRTRSAVDFGMICDRTFIDAVRTGDGSAIRCNYRDGMKSVAIALACNKSMETGLPVVLEG